MQGGEPPLHAATPRWGEVGIHGVPRPREWDAVLGLSAHGVEADEGAAFVLIEPGWTYVEEAGGSLADAFVRAHPELPTPYRARAVRIARGRFSVGIQRIEVARVPGLAGDELTLTVRNGTRALHVDGRPSFDPTPALDALARGRFDAYVVQGHRLDGDAWEVQIAPL